MRWGETTGTTNKGNVVHLLMVIETMEKNKAVQGDRERGPV